jgi:hypothetical protein
MKEHTKQLPNKSYDGDISIGSGLEIGSVHPAHTKHQVKEAKDNRKPHAASHAQRNAALAGNANPEGEGSVMPYTGHGGQIKENPAAIKASRSQRNRAEASQSNELGEVAHIMHHNNTPNSDNLK